MSIRRTSSFSKEQLTDMAKLVAESVPTAASITPTVPVRSAYHEAAAVMAWFDPSSLEPIERVPDALAAPLDAVIADSTRLAGGSRYALRSDVRIPTLQRLREEQRLAAALAANPPNLDDPTDRVLRGYLTGQPKPVVSMTSEELAAARDVTDGLRAAGFTGLPSREELVGQYEWRTLLQSFQHLAGEHFAGRRAELAALRDYADVLPPQSATSAVAAAARQLFNLKQKPPLIIYGPGGVGKSTLVSRFILEHAQALERDRFPFAYLDFDRVEVAYDQPLTLLVEAVRQLGIQYPQARERCEAVRGAWLRDLTAASGGEHPGEFTVSPQAMRRVLEVAIRDFVSLLSSLGASDRPVLFVLDTFEEVQRRSDEFVEAIWRLLETLRAGIPRLRVVIVGRAELPATFRTQPLPLLGLDREAAVAYLVARGVSDRSVAERVAAQLGGTPLSLNLAVEVLRKEGGLTSGDLDIRTREYLFLRVDDGLIQRQLYTRILSYIPDEEVRRLAHPGLVLRYLTPELIFEVLKEPCRLDSVSTLAEAKNLFDRLRKEVALVIEVDSNTVRHRPDVRKLMVPLVRSAEPDKARDVDQRAVACFTKRDKNVAARAEEIYHRLWLNEPFEEISRRWMEGVETLLSPSIDEFSGARKAYLAARLGEEVDPQTRRLAALEDWEHLTERKAADLLASNRPQEALELIRARSERSASSPLSLLESTILIELDRKDAALEVLEVAIQRAIEAGDREHALSLTTTGAKIAVRGSRAEVAPQYRSRLQGFRQTAATATDQLRVVVPTLAMALLEPLDDHELVDKLRTELTSTVDALADPQFESVSEAAMWALTMIKEPKHLSRLLGLVKVQPVRPEDLRSLAGAVAQFDFSQSVALGHKPGALARQFNVESRTTVTETWSDYFVRTPAPRLQAFLVQLLDRYTQELPADLIDGICRLPRFALGLESNRVSERSPEGPSPRFLGDVRVRSAARAAADHQALISAFADAFPSERALRELLAYRLNRRLEAITPNNVPLLGMVGSVIRAAEAEYWLRELITKAIEAVPSNTALTAIAGRFGVETLQSGLEAVLTDKPPFVDVQQWRERLNLIEGQVCRVEVRGEPRATGFLVGPDLVLTADFALEELITAKTKRSDLALRFDYKAGGSGTVSPGVAFALADNWLVSRDAWVNESKGLGYTLIRLRNSAGLEPIGGATLESAASLRRWIAIPEKPKPVRTGDGLMIVQHPLGGPLKLAFGDNAVVGQSADGTRIFHSVNTEPGSSGSPCFSMDFELVGMHIGPSTSVSDADTNVAVSIDAIRIEASRAGGAARFTSFE